MPFPSKHSKISFGNQDEKSMCTTNTYLMGGKKPRSFQFNNWQNTFKDAVQKSERKKHPTLGAKKREGKM